MRTIFALTSSIWRKTFPAIALITFLNELIRALSQLRWYATETSAGDQMQSFVIGAYRRRYRFTKQLFGISLYLYLIDNIFQEIDTHTLHQIYKHYILFIFAQNELMIRVWITLRHGICWHEKDLQINTCTTGAGKRFLGITDTFSIR